MSEPFTETAPAATSAPCDQQRLARVDDALGEALASANALDANLGALQADLHRMACRMQPLIDASLSGPLDWEQLARTAPGLDLFLRVAKQSERLAQLQLRIEGQRAAAAARKAQAALAEPSEISGD